LLKTFTFRRRERGTLLTDNLGTLANAFELSYLLTHIEVYFCTMTRLTPEAQYTAVVYSIKLSRGKAGKLG